MTGKPEILLRPESGRKKVSVILIDWNVRESFHSLDYLNRQTVSRDDYELIWVEFYQRKAEPIRKMLEGSGRPVIDQWIVLSYPNELLYHKHRAYNAGLLAARGEICVICDSDAMFRPTFIENVIKAFEEPDVVAVHLDQVRNFDRKYYPFNYPSFEEVTGAGAVNWLGNTTMGLSTEMDRLHRANYGACMAARRSDLLAIGGADEHLDYLGYCCGPYDLTFRLLNRGGRERWLTNEFLYHTWHPNQTSINSDYSGPHDGRFLSLISLHAKATGQIRPSLENPCLGIEDDSTRFEEFIRYVAEHSEPNWRADNAPKLPSDFVYRVENNYRDYDLFVHRDEWFAVPQGQEFDSTGSSTLRGKDEKTIRAMVSTQRLKRTKKPRIPIGKIPAEPLRTSNTGFSERLVGKPKVLLRHESGRKKVSVILTDWNVRESFHSIEYLNRQTANRDDYELIWVEFYDRKAKPIQRMIASPGRPMLDQWIVLGYPPELLFHKHRAYNAGLFAARGDVCVISDSESMYRPTFIENVIKAFDETAYSVVHIDQVKNLEQRFHPFNYPGFDEVTGSGAVNWLGNITLGLWSEEDRLHRANYGACLAARRSDLLGIGAADEHTDYLGSIGSPSEMSFRLSNRGRRERWLTNEYLCSTWNTNSLQNDSAFAGPHDGRYVSLRALHLRSTGQTRPYVENPCVRLRNDADRFLEFLHFVAEQPEPTWRADNPPAMPPDFAYRVENNYRGYDLYVYRDEWFAHPAGVEIDNEQAETLWAPDEESIRSLIHTLSPEFLPSQMQPSRVRRFVRNLLAEPLHCLPRRAWRAGERALGKLRKKVLK